ncbi:PEP-CTERM sorting domain-containing protein [Alteromonas gracilis]|uniref:PEP-CTERM sorting domain-containing protein n=1 Tax=Alteromonas gracilis TaxID=1479524 RepID=UPI0030CC27B4
MTYPTLTEAKYWLVGAYNTHFDPSTSVSDIDGSGFKLAALGFSQTTTKTTPPPKEVSAPNTLAFMGLGLGFVMFRRKRLV